MAATARPDDDRACAHQRRVAAPPDAVFAAITRPERLARWWGPAGFRTTTHAIDVRPGGEWRYTMHGPDGTDHANHSRFVEIVPGHRVLLEHLATAGGHHFMLTITLSGSDDGTTAVGWRQVFDDVAERERVGAFVTVANEQVLDRLQAEAEGQNHRP
jgi:uncharacterized protein YndB with AHSA1/START domain